MPRFDGTLQLARPVTRAARGRRRSSSSRGGSPARSRATAKSAVLEQVEFQYGPDDRADQAARATPSSLSAAQPRLEGVLSSPQIDLDRLLALPEAARRRPLVAIKAFADYFAGAQRLPIPVQLGISIENVTLAGAVAPARQRRCHSRTASTGTSRTWSSARPALTQVRLSGRLGMTANGIAFAGPAKIEARDPRALVAWLDRSFRCARSPGRHVARGRRDQARQRPDRGRPPQGRARPHDAAKDASPIRGPRGERPPRIEAALSAPEIDLDRVTALVQGVFGDTAFEWPREGTLALKVGKAVVAGVEAKGADVNMQFDAARG